jgi:CubicO group peptidase (beta-lactamase class C family)
MHRTRRLVCATIFWAILLVHILPTASATPTGSGEERHGAMGYPPARRLDSASCARLLDSLIGAGLAKYHIPGIVVSIVQDSEVVFAKGYGYADVERKIPFGADSTVIRIASVSKLFTGTAVMQLVEKGVLDMHRDINNVLTRFKVEEWPGKPITLHHLLTHTAGFDDRYIGKSAWTEETQVPLGEFLATRLPRRICTPGEVYTYSNFSNALAGFVVEEATHQEYATYVRKKILEPLGMMRSDYRLRPELKPMLAQCYAYTDDGIRPQPFDFINDYPGGQMLSTGTDMAKFMIAHLQLGRWGEKRILGEGSARMMHSVQFIHQRDLEGAMGYSFGVDNVRTRTLLSHDGGYTGVSSRLCLCPESGVGFFVACNIMNGALVEDVSRVLLDEIIPAVQPDTTKYPLSVLPAYDREIDGFTGTYRFSRYAHGSFEKIGVLSGMIGAEMTIRRNDEGMILMDTFYGKPRRMIQIQPGVFQSIDDKYMCAFRRDGSGRVTHLFTNGTTAFEKLLWYETVTVQRVLIGVCLLFFSGVAVTSWIVRIRRRGQKPFARPENPIGWWSVNTASVFLSYFLGFGIVMGFVIPEVEQMVGFAHGMHWSMYLVQTIGLLGVLCVIALVTTIIWKFILGRRGGEQPQSRLMGCMTAVVGIGFVWLLWCWNLIGYRF